MSVVAVVAPSGDVMFATSLGLAGHPSPPLPVSLPTSLLSRQRQQSALFVITSGKIRPVLSIKLPCHPPLSSRSLRSPGPECRCKRPTCRCTRGSSAWHAKVKRVTSAHLLSLLKSRLFHLAPRSYFKLRCQRASHWKPNSISVPHIFMLMLTNRCFALLCSPPHLYHHLVSPSRNKRPM